MDELSASSQRRDDEMVVRESEMSTRARNFMSSLRNRAETGGEIPHVTRHASHVTDDNSEVRKEEDSTRIWTGKKSEKRTISTYDGGVQPGHHQATDTGADIRYESRLLAFGIRVEVDVEV
jgi:hypothetical protein